MGNKIFKVFDDDPASHDRKAPFARRSENEDWLNIYLLPEDVIEFQADLSYAVCAGVGKQMYPEGGIRSVGSPADNDAKLVSHTLQRHYNFPEAHLKVLNSFEELKPTKDNIKETLKQMADMTPPEGILIFHFSGHCSKVGNQALLIPADFRNDRRDSAMTLDDIVATVGNSRAKCLVLILDCCYAGFLAEGLVYQTDISVPVYVLAACNSREKSLFHPTFGYGFFSYFLAWYLKKHTQQGCSQGSQELPVKECIVECEPILEAFLSLLRPGNKNIKSQHPVGLFKNFGYNRPAINNVVSGEDQTDYLQEVDEFREFRKFVNSVPNGRDELDSGKNVPDLVSFTDLPEEILSWLFSIAESSLQKLDAAHLLNKSEVYVSVIVFITQSVAQMLFANDNYQNHNEAFCQPVMFVNAFIRISEAMKHVHQDLKPQITHMEYCLRTYLRQVVSHLKDTLDITEMAIRLGDLMDLAKAIKEDIACRELALIDDRPVSDLRVQDQPDSEESSKKQLLEDYLQSLPGSMGIPFMPAISSAK